jgi:hypothetical protein
MTLRAGVFVLQDKDTLVPMFLLYEQETARIVGIDLIANQQRGKLREQSLKIDFSSASAFSGWRTFQARNT